MLLDRKRNATPRLSKLGFLATLGVLIVAVAHCAQVSPVIAVPERTTFVVEPADQKEEPFATLPSKEERNEIYQTQQNKALKQQDEILKQRDQALREQAEALERLQVEALKQQDQAVRQQAEVLRQQAEALKRQEKSLLGVGQGLSFGGEERKPAIPESELLPLLISIAKTDANADVRREAIKAIGRLESDASIDALLELYDTLGDVGLKQEVIAHLLRWKGDNAKALAKLTQIAKTSSDLELRTAAFRQLAGVQGDAGAEALISIYDGSNDVKVKESIIHYWGLNNSKKAIQKLMVIAKSDPDAKMRLLAVRRLGSLDEAWPYHLLQGVVRGAIAPEPSESPEPPKPAEQPRPPR
jgi:HEAT repeat protein